MNNHNLFDEDLSDKLKEEGMARAEANAETPLQLARWSAKSIARDKGVVNADDVGRRLQWHGIDSLGPAAGSLFKGKEWEFTGNWVKSKRITNHSRMIREWRLTGE